MKKLVSLLIAAVFLLGMTLPAMAADWNFYGQSRLQTFWVDKSKEATDYNDSTLNLDHALNYVNRVGAKVDAGVINGRWEMGIHSGGTPTPNYSRLIYGTVDLDEAVGMPGTLLVGRAYMPLEAISLGVSLQTYPHDANMLGYLGYMDRQEGLQYSLDGFKFALVKPNVPDNSEVQLPMIQATYSMNMMDGLALNLGGVYQTYDLDKGNDPGGGDSVTSWNFSGNVRMSMMDPLYVNLAGFYGQNVGEFGACNVKGTPATTNDGSSVSEDTTTYSTVGVIGVNLAGGIRVETGAGYQVSDNDDWKNEDDQSKYYLQAQIPITDNGNAFILPEVGMTDYMDGTDGKDEGDETWYGMQTRVMF